MTKMATLQPLQLRTIARQKASQDELSATAYLGKVLFPDKSFRQNSTSTSAERFLCLDDFCTVFTVNGETRDIDIKAANDFMLRTEDKY